MQCAEKIVSAHWRAGSASTEMVGQGGDGWGHPQGVVHMAPMFEIINPIFEHLHLAKGVAKCLQDLDSLCRTPTVVAECVQAFDSLCGARARVTERLLAYYRRL